MKRAMIITLSATVLYVTAALAFDAPLPKGNGPLYGCTCPWSCIGYKIMHMFNAQVTPPMSH